jgi:uncharacterized protein
VKARLLALAILLVAPGCSARADVSAPQDEPARVAGAIPERPSGPVLDQADVLPAGDEAALGARLREYWDRNRTAVVVASVDSLGGETIERYSLQLAQEWDIGDRHNLRGLLVLVAPNERQVRIEVSCGLENVITDVFAGRVIREHMTPRFREGSLADGTLAGIDALIEQLDASPNPAPVSESCRSQMKEAA